MHVTAGELLGREKGYVESRESPSRDTCSPRVYAMDCEMCYTTAGLQLTRVTVVDPDMATVFESIVKPSHPIVDYNTR